MGLIALSCQNNSKTNAPSNVDSLKSKQNNVVNSVRLYYAASGYAYTLPDSIDGMPISFYLDNPNVAEIAKQLYLNKFIPTDNDSTTILLSLVMTNDNRLRPFYRWCLDFVIQISDGALGEYSGKPAFNYAIKYPQEFFSYMEKDSTGLRYKWWTEMIAYSGIDSITTNDNKLKTFIISSMTKNCTNCEPNTKKRIDKFAQDIVNAIHLSN